MTNRPNDYNAFLREVDKTLATTTGMRVHQLPNHNWRAAYKCGLKPSLAAHNAILIHSPKDRGR